MTQDSSVRCRQCNHISVVRELRRMQGPSLFVGKGKTAPSGHGFCKCNATEQGALVFFLGEKISVNEVFAELLTLQASI